MKENKYKATDPKTGAESKIKTFKSIKGAAIAFQPKEKVYFSFFKDEQAAIANIKSVESSHPKGSLRLAELTEA